jgi:hypothetical protein
VPRLATVFSLVFLAFAAAGCTGGSGSSADLSGDEQKVADTIDALSEHAQKGDERQICRRVLSADVVKGLRDCDRVVGEAIKDVDSFRLTVKDVKISGTTARARVEAGGDSGDARTVPLVREGDEWKIAELPAPPAAS